MTKRPGVTTAADLGIVPVTRYQSAASPFTSAEPKTYGGNARLVAISLPKVHWLDRPVVGGERKALK